MKHQPEGWLFLMKKVVLPPLRIWFPAMVNQFIITLKDFLR